MKYVWDDKHSKLSAELQRLSVDIAPVDPDFALYLQDLEREARRLEDHDGDGADLEELAEYAGDVVGRQKWQKARTTIEAAIARAETAMPEESVRDALPEIVVQEAGSGKDVLSLVRDAGRWAQDYLALRADLTRLLGEALGERIDGAGAEDFPVYVERLIARVPEDGEELAKLRRFARDADSLAPDVEKLRQLANTIDHTLELLDGLGADARKLVAGAPLYDLRDAGRQGRA